VPNDATVELETGAIFGFDEQVNFEVIDGLPAGVTVGFDKNPVTPGENAIATFDMSAVTADGNYEVTVRAIAGADTVLRKLYFNIVYNDFTSLAGTGPVDGQSGLGLLPTFTWTDLPHADLYEFQLATSPTFADTTILDTYSGTNSTYTPTTVSLLESKIYFWRVRALNECGASEFAPTNTFQTFTVSCAGFPSADVPKNISDTGLPTVVSELPVIQSGTITDLNVKNLKGTHDALADLEVSLTSPSGTNVVLFQQICGNVTQFNMNLNDEAPFNIACPPINGQTFKPQNPLAAFIGENTLGTWKLTVQVINTIGQGGVLNSWAVEFCGSISPIGPLLVKNDTIYVKPLATRHFYNFELKVEDANTPDENLTFRIVNNTQHGTVVKSGIPLGIGGTFTMSDVHSQKVAYINTNPDATYDYFTFIVEDGTGGWLGTPRFNIVIDENATTGVSEKDFANSILLYPNPASQQLNIAFQQPLSAGSSLFVSDAQGRMLFTRPIGTGEQTLQLDTHTFASGIYFLTVKSPEGVFAKKFLIQQ
jgi:subtilisin-like proprotein convertase family protein